MLGVLGVLGGIVMMRRPGETVLVIILIVGLWLILSGVTEAIVALMEPVDRGARLLAALVDFVIGILILALPKVSLATVAILVAIAFLVRGIFAVYVGWHARRSPPNWPNWHRSHANPADVSHAILARMRTIRRARLREPPTR